MNKQIVVCPENGYYNDLSWHEKTWRKLKCLLLSEKSQSERLYTVIPTI